MASSDVLCLNAAGGGYNVPTGTTARRPALPSPIRVLEENHQDNWGWALATCNWQHQLAEDVLQESYLRVLDGRARYSARSSEKTWFFGVIKRVANELGRKQQPLTWHVFSSLAGAKEELSTDSGLEAAEQAQATDQLRLALQNMPQRQREVLHLVFYLELTLEEAAQTLGIGLGSTRTHYHRGKARLAELLEISDEEN